MTDRPKGDAEVNLEGVYIRTADYEDEVMRTIMREALRRYRNELMDDEERERLWDRIARIRKALRLRRGD